MRTIAELTENIIKESPYLEEALGLGIINLSSLARKIRPQIESVNLKKTSYPAIIMALHRLSLKLKRKNFGKAAKLSLPKDIVLRSNLVEYVFENSAEFNKVRFEVLQMSSKVRDGFFSITQGVSEAAIVFSNFLVEDLEKLTKRLQLMRKDKHLSAVTMRFSHDTIYLPGVYYHILKALAWEGVSIAEVISAGSELSLIFEQSKIDRAFLVIKKLIAS